MSQEEKGGLLYVRLWKGPLKNTVRLQSKRRLIARGLNDSQGRLAREDDILDRLPNKEHFD